MFGQSVDNPSPASSPPEGTQAKPQCLGMEVVGLSRSAGGLLLRWQGWATTRVGDHVAWRRSLCGRRRGRVWVPRGVAPYARWWRLGLSVSGVWCQPHMLRCPAYGLRWWFWARRAWWQRWIWRFVGGGSLAMLDLARSGPWWSSLGQRLVAMTGAGGGSGEWWRCCCRWFLISLPSVGAAGARGACRRI